MGGHRTSGFVRVVGLNLLVFLVASGQWSCSRSASGTGGAVPEKKPPRGFVSLFNGKDLKGWWSPQGPLLGAWYVENGEIRARGKGPGRQALYTRKVYENFILELDFKIGPKGNSGIFFRTANPRDPVQTGIETGGYTEISGRGIAPGDRIIAGGQNFINDGDSIEISGEAD